MVTWTSLNYWFGYTNVHLKWALEPGILLEMTKPTERTTSSIVARKASLLVNSSRIES